MPWHQHPIRIYYEDTDFSGAVYHASYLRFLERGRTELLRSLGIHQAAIHAGQAGPVFGFVVRAMRIDFLKPARMDDLAVVETAIWHIGGASAEFRQRIVREADLLVAAEVKVAAIANGRPFRVPTSIHDKLRAALTQPRENDRKL
ncbi:MAG: tol-pal system-associated acyl-CoA thioesterase [Methylobacteriaceae bacterium]|nr:tol-pal system-associated acyl-CoA thioesterase [Methylobacteriaceae bacterium]